jgi:hypothetical protein
MFANKFSIYEPHAQYKDIQRYNLNVENIYKMASRDQKRWRAHKNSEKSRSRDRDKKQSDYM